MPSTTELPLAPVASTPPLPSGVWRTLSAPTRPERTKLPEGLDAAWDALTGKVLLRLPRRRQLMTRANRILGLAEQHRKTAESRLREQARETRDAFRVGDVEAEQLDQALALVCEIADRQLGLRPHPVQIAAGLALHLGYVIELATGEGKTLSAVLPAVLAGWRGRGCHVITVNDYLAQRDADEMGPIYRFCGLSVDHIEQEMKGPDRKKAYHADVTYCTNKEVAADFLRDKLAMGTVRDLPTALLQQIVGQGRGSSQRAARGASQVVQRGLECAIVDEADSVLIDEAVTPLIISTSVPNVELLDAYVKAADIAGQLQPARHYRIDQRWREVSLTDAGRDRIAVASQELGGVWSGARRSEELVTQALTARELFHRDKQYVVHEDKIVIVDEFTGRLMPDRTWRDGMHQAVEAKEGLKIQPVKATLARVSFQKFFRLYRKLSGMTGTAWEGRGEFWRVYHMPVVRLPTHKPCIRKIEPDITFVSSDDKLDAVVKEILSMRLAGRPVLVGTRSVHVSEALSGMLKDKGVEHSVLNAVRHAEEAQIIAGAGLPGRVTVATNMAGRGTDIKLGPGVRELGGLYVIATERHESGRVDRQLFGRCARQGDPGTASAFVSLDDELIRRFTPRWMSRAVGLAAGGGVAPRFLAKALFQRAQTRAQRFAQKQRQGVLKSDDWLSEFLGFAGAE